MIIVSNAQRFSSYSYLQRDEIDKNGCFQDQFRHVAASSFADYNKVQLRMPMNQKREDSSRTALPHRDTGAATTILSTRVRLVMSIHL